MDANAKKSLELVLAEFRRGIEHHRAVGATEERIMQILSASIRFAVQEVHDPNLCLWLCDQFSKAARKPHDSAVFSWPKSALLAPISDTDRRLLGE